MTTMNRRQLLRHAIRLSAGLGAISAGGILLPSCYANTGNPSGVVETATGKVQGYVNQGVSVFKGIPYGASTAGKNRFMPPQPVEPWTSVKETVEYGPSAPQSVSGGSLGEGQSEDCLALNIWTPEANDNKKRPVMFWCHGGGFTSLSGSSPSYDGTNLCNRGDVVVVTVNHRLNVMGFTSLAEQGGDALAHSGTVGMQDLVAALTWVKDNIEQFGGDPDTVMIFGESGGGRKVGTLLAMPAARGLFHRAVIQSGPSMKLVSAENGAALADKLMQELGLRQGDIQGLQALPAAKIIAAYQALARQPGYRAVTAGFAPVVDGESLPYPSFDPVASPVNPDVPLIVGANRTELTLQMRGDEAAFNLTWEQLPERVQRIAGDRTEEVIAVYREAVPDAPASEIYFLIASDARYVVPCSEIAARRSQLNGGNVYAYYLTWPTKTLGGKLMTPHALDIPFIFDNTHAERTVYGFTTGTEEERALADKVSDTWIAFARSGNPNAGKLPEWKPYTTETRNTMVIDNNSQLVDDPFKARREIMREVISWS